MKAFINGRKLFGTPFYPVPGTEVVSPEEFCKPRLKIVEICGKNPKL